MQHDAQLGQGGYYRLTAANDDLVRRMSDAPARASDIAHPIHGYLGALGGLDTAIGDFCRGIGVDFDTGPVLGRCEMRLARPFRTETTYRVSLQVESLQRKPSRKYGAADHLALTITLAEGEVETSALRFTMITPAGPALATDAPPVAPALPDWPGLPLGPVSGADMALWCRMLNDENAIHLSPEAAKRAGHRARVNPGPANLAYLFSARMRLHPHRPLQGLTARFHDNAFEGDTLHCAIAPDGSQGLLLRDGQPLLSTGFTE